jgi:hypothetical protein
LQDTELLEAADVPPTYPGGLKRPRMSAPPTPLKTLACLLCAGTAGMFDSAVVWLLVKEDEQLADQLEVARHMRSLQTPG